jgi:hypothetical protein
MMVVFFFVLTHVRGIYQACILFFILSFVFAIVASDFIGRQTITNYPYSDDDESV